MVERPTTHHTDADLERALTELGRELDYPATPDLRQAVYARLSAAPERRGWQAALRDLFTPAVRRYAYAAVVLLALVGAAVAASPSARNAVADRLGLDGVEISTNPTVTVPANT